MKASEFLFEKYGIAITEHNKNHVAIKPSDLLKYMEEYAALRQPPVSGSLCGYCKDDRTAVCCQTCLDEMIDHTANTQ
jgi:hypothetical protein